MSSSFNLSSPTLQEVVNTSATTTIETDEEKETFFHNYIWPRPHMWFLISCHLVVFVVGLCGNLLVCVAVCRNRSMRTVTNIFIVNLAVADFLVVLVCLPPTVVTDVTQTWFFGRLGCKMFYFLQMSSVAVAVLTLMLISLDRWYAFCYPMRFHNSTGWALRCTLIIWTTSLLIGAPYLVFMEVVANEWSPRDSVYFSVCSPSWQHPVNITVSLLWAVCLYLLPLVFMAAAYWQIGRVLWKQPIPGQCLTASRHINQRRSECSCDASVHVRSRRKAAKMIAIVVITFAFCLFFIHLINIIRVLFDERLRQLGPTVGKIFQSCVLISHWLFYFNSAINPVIYSFMSSKFRREFMHASRCADQSRQFTSMSTRLRSHRRNSQPPNVGVRHDSPQSRQLAARHSVATTTRQLRNHSGYPDAPARGRSCPPVKIADDRRRFAGVSDQNSTAV